MADWFKVYETDLDDPRLQWAMGTNPNCAIVFIFLLCRCCHFKSNTIPWNKDLDFLTMASTLKMSGPNANDALRMLEHIEFITISGGSLLVSHWNDRQSDYMNRRDYYRERYKKQKDFTVKSVNSHRGEEKRKEESTERRKIREAFRGGPIPGESVFLKTGEMPHEYR